ncbi:MAG TPA: asparagine synthase (glutamine-hydrolyzing) [Candidatus Angelobacter sp.]|nr:asparagine synthase (glutamine-hydrolyzing) [Candidatus Angelobacter sp.]
MCGIVGIFRYGGSQPVSADLLRGMMQVIEHRGPDDSGEVLEDGIGLGMRRLSIIDLEGGKQPVENETGDIRLVFNGEIYNFRSLQDELRGRGHLLRSASDTEVIVHLYEEFGDECVNHLRGMFGFALWDNHRRRLLLARDRLGIKPLYYADVNGTLVFGSEIKSILRHPEVSVELDHEALSNFLSLKYIPAPQTLFRGIRALPPGFLLTCDRDGIKLRKYWDLSFTSPVSRSEEECAEELEALLRESVLLHLQSDVPFGAFLSGGLDSSTIVALMAECLDNPVNTFSIGFENRGSELSEAHYAKLVSNHYGTRHHEITITSADFLSHAEKVVWHLDQPVGDLACFANMMLAECASQHVKMVLTGEGGDELFAGYARYAGERFRPVTKLMPRLIGHTLVRGSSLLPGLRRAKLALNAVMQKDEESRFLHWFALFSTDEKIRLLSPEVRAEVSASASAEHVFAHSLAEVDSTIPLNRMLYVDTKLWLPDDLLARGDKMSMAASLEARVPLLDHKLVEFAAALPPHLKIQKLTRKYLLRKVAAKILPEPIIRRKKQGFPVPISGWLRNESRPFVQDLLSRETVRRRGLLDPDYVQRILGQHMRGSEDRGAQLWALIQLELWHQRFLDAPSAQAPIEEAASVSL